MSIELDSPYSLMLQSELLGIDSLPSTPMSNNKSHRSSTSSYNSPQISPKKILHFSPKTAERSKSFFSPISNNRFISSPLVPNRKIPTTPFKMLDAPGLKDDFYINVLDWSKSNIISVGLESTAYLYNAVNNNV